MKKLIYFSVAIIFIVFFISIAIFNRYFVRKSVFVQTESATEQYVGKIKVSNYEDNFSVRVLILKHSINEMVVGDTRMVIEAADLARSKGLSIKDIGDHYINKDGKINRVSLEEGVVWGKSFYELDQLKSFVSEQMKINAKSGDTLVIFTVGHGSPGGSLEKLGQRRGVMMALVEAAEENNQETLWWQLSCYAAAGLPSISELNQKQQKLFSIVASSDANRQSPAYVEGDYMEKLFVAMAENSSKINPDKDKMIIASELKNFMASEVSRVRGDLVFAKDDNEPIFGIYSIANEIPIFNWNFKRKENNNNYIPIPN